MGQLLEDLTGKLDADSALSFGTDLFASGFYDADGSPDAQVALVEYPGLEPSWTMGKGNPPTAILPRVQVAARATSYVAARALALVAYASLGNLVDEVIGGTRYIRVAALQFPFDMGPDQAGRQTCGFNLQVHREP